MTTYKLTIDGRLPGLNDYQLACRTGWASGSAMKKKQIKIVSLYIAKYLKNVHIEKMIDVHFKWYEKDKRRDKDNISSFGRKVILDALVDNEIIIDDGWKFVNNFTDDFFIDKENPRIEVEIVEVNSLEK